MRLKGAGPRPFSVYSADAGGWLALCASRCWRRLLRRMDFSIARRNADIQSPPRPMEALYAMPITRVRPAAGPFGELLGGGDSYREGEWLAASTPRLCLYK